MNRKVVKVVRLGDKRGYGFVPGTPAERFHMVWPLTREVAALSGLDVEQRLQRHITVIKRRAR